THETIFLLTKSQRYYYDAHGIREAVSADSFARQQRGRSTHHQWATGGPGGQTIAKDTSRCHHPLGRNKRTVWTIPTQPLSGGHSATFPEKLVELCLRAGTGLMGCCAACGAPRKRVVQRGTPSEEWQRACGATREGTYEGTAQKDYAANGIQDASAVKA